MNKNTTLWNKTVAFAFIFSFCILYSNSATAAWMPLSDLVSISDLPDASLIVGDKFFSEFEINGIIIGGGEEPTAESVFIQGGWDGETGNYGIRLKFDWSVGSNQSINAGINFKLSILPDYDQSFIDKAILIIEEPEATGTGVVAATETIWDGPMPWGNWLTTLSCSWQVGDAGLNLKDYANIADTKQMWIRKGITITGGDQGTANSQYLGRRL
ncbi:MAG: hypothetical protein ACYS32_09875, partial [Planctomycetota bacterium]